MKKTRVWLPMVLAIVALAALAADGAWAQGPENSPRWPTILEQLKGVRPGSPLSGTSGPTRTSTCSTPRRPTTTRASPSGCASPGGRRTPSCPTCPRTRWAATRSCCARCVEWMVSHQDLRAGAGARAATPVKVTSATGEQRISGAAAHPRSESDIRINYWNPSDHRRLEQHRRQRPAGAVLVRPTAARPGVRPPCRWSPATPSTPIPTVDWTSDGTAWSTTIGINAAGTMLQHARLHARPTAARPGPSTPPFSGTQTSADKQMHVDRPQRDLAVQGQHLRLWHNGLPAS